MSTTIGPALGHGPWTQQGVGTTPGYDAIDFRRSVTGFERGEGVSTYGSFRVSQRGAGANMSVDVNMDDGAWVRGDAVSLQGLYYVAPHSATINEVITAADATNPRIDRVVLEVKDTQHDASGSNLAQTRVIAGTPTGGATMDNLTGAAAVPSSSLLLADVLVAATDTSITDSEIRDRRAFIAGLPPLLTDVDMARFDPLWAPPVVPLVQMSIGWDLMQAAYLARLDRRIVAATRLRWKYRHGSTAGVGNYVIGIYDASGRKIIDTGSVAATGALNTYQVRSETISATTFEPGYYYVLFGNDWTSGTIEFQGLHAEVTNAGFNESGPFAPNMLVRSATGGITAPTTLLGFTDVHGLTAATAVPAVPFLGISVG